MSLEKLVGIPGYIEWQGVEGSITNGRISVQQGSNGAEN
jgi:hypothetical protein